MADNEQPAAGKLPGFAEDFIAQQRTMIEGLQGLIAAGIRAPVPAAPAPSALPASALPGMLSAKQLASIADSVASQRRSIDALKTQLTAFDEQLAMLEQILGPLAEWARSWADLERRLVNAWPGPPEESGGS